MDWQMVITRNRDALQRIVAALFAMARFVESAAALTSPGLSRRSLGEGGSGSVTLPRHVFAAIMLILRPAESALRRLILIAARGLRLKPRLSRPLPAGLPSVSAASALRTPSFSLFDPLKHFDLEDFDNNALPHFAFHSGEDAALHTPHFLPPDEPIDAAPLLLRLRALRSALGDLPRQARRLARWQARRDLALKSKGPFKPMRISPCRPGLPPGWRQRQLHEVDAILRDCHYFAGEVMNRPNTS